MACFILVVQLYKLILLKTYSRLISQIPVLTLGCIAATIVTKISTVEAQ